MTLFTRNLNYLRAKTFGFPSPRHPGDFRTFFILPLNGSITPYSSPRQSLSRFYPAPECIYYPLFVTPAIFKPGSTVFKNQRKNKSRDA